MLHEIHISNNSIHSHIIFHFGVFVGAPMGSRILEFLLKYRIKKLTIKTDIKIDTYHKNCNITVQTSYIYYPLIHWILM